MPEAEEQVPQEAPQEAIFDEGEGEFHLLEGEKLLKTIKPHYMAFYDMYGIWAAVILISIVFIFYGDVIVSIVGNPGLAVSNTFLNMGTPSDNDIINTVPFLTIFQSLIYSVAHPLNESFKQYAQIPLWIGALFTISMAFSVLKIEWKWAFLIPGTAIGSLILTMFLELDPWYSYMFAIIVSIVGMVFVELYRKAHTFYLTDSRIVTEVSFLSYKRNELEYESIENLVLNQDLVGRLFDFGVLIPATASGLGMGQDHAFVAVGGAGQSPLGGVMAGGVMGGRSITTPRARSMYSLFGIPHPEEIQNIISGQMRMDNQAPLLREMTGILEEIRDGKGKEGG